MRLSLLFAALSLGCALASAQEVVRVAGSSTLVLPFVNATSALRNQDIELRITADSNSPNAIMGVGSGACDLALSTRSVQPAEHAYFSDRPMTETIIGYQALVFCVSNDVWTAGVRSLKKADVLRIYEGKLKNWKEIGGPDRAIKFYNPEQGKGVWEFFVGWLYGDMRKAPVGASSETMSTPEEARNLVEFNGGSLAILPPSRADTPGVHGLALREESGKLVPATLSNVRKAVYPLTRPVVVVTAFRPSGPFKRTIDFMLSAPGQEMVRRSDIVPVVEEETE